jgi:putative flippase GtrA
LNYRLVRFGAVGAVGFVVDASVLVAIVMLTGIAPLPARVLSFLIAATATFVLNQRFTFQFGDGFSFGRWASYLTTTAIGACVNVAIYRLWIAYAGAIPLHLVIGTAVGSIAAMFINYFASSTLVFRPIDQRPCRR